MPETLRRIRLCGVPASPLSVDAAGDDGRSSVLVLFCRRPSLRIGKQRLAAELGAEAALSVAEALLDCALEDASAWPGEVVISPAESADEEWAAQVLDGRAEVVPQPPLGFGERLEYIDRTLRTRGVTRIAFIGSDAPGLDSTYYSAADAALADHDVVIGPALDGGVTLMGARVPWRGLAQLPWSQDTLYASLFESCRQAGLSTALLPPNYDVDTGADIDRAIEALKNDQRPARCRLRAVLIEARASSSAPGPA